MPWTALPFEDRDRKNAISTKFGIRGIPSLLIFDVDGTLITADGR
jgi:nucleoredoxin